MFMLIKSLTKRKQLQFVLRTINTRARTREVTVTCQFTVHVELRTFTLQHVRVLNSASASSKPRPFTKTILQYERVDYELNQLRYCKMIIISQCLNDKQKFMV